MCFSPVDISPLWWCLTWVRDLLSPLGNHLEPVLSFLFFCLSHQPVKLKCTAEHEAEKYEIHVEYEPQHIWGFKVSSLTHRLTLSPPTAIPLCRSATTALRILKGKGEDQREKLCRVAGLLAHFRATSGETPMEEGRVHWERL